MKEQTNKSKCQTLMCKYGNIEMVAKMKEFECFQLNVVLCVAHLNISMTEIYIYSTYT